MASGKGISEGHLGRRCRNMIIIYSKAGIIIKPKICDKCRMPSDLILAHHFDYILPFDVLWLCHKCHRGLHSKLRILTPKDKQIIIYNRMIILKYIILDALKKANIKDTGLNIDIEHIPLKVRVDGMIITACKYCGCVWNMENENSLLICPRCNNDINEKSDIVH